MSEPQLKKGPTDAQTILFMVILSFVCALVLSVLASALTDTQEKAKDLDRSRQMLIAAGILDHKGHFILKDKEGKTIPAKHTGNGVLVPGSEKDIATQKDLLEIYNKRIVPILVDGKGKEHRFDEEKIDIIQYTAEHKKTGYYKQPLKLIYKVLPNPDPNNPKESEQAVAYVIPVNGFGLWDAIYGYLAIEPDGNTVIGATWYDQKETPGLGANIADPAWQSLFPGKKIFQQGPGGQTDFKSAPVGIIVVKGKVSDVLGNSPKSKSAVDGMAGATLTGNGVNDAYRDVLNAYRPFLQKLHDIQSKEQKTNNKA